MARHAAVDIAMVFRLRPRTDTPERLPPESLVRLRKTLCDAGLPLRDGAAADARLTELRGLYEPFVSALATFLLIDLPPVNPDREPVDNWQTSAGCAARPASMNCRPSIRATTTPFEWHEEVGLWWTPLSRPKKSLCYVYYRVCP